MYNRVVVPLDGSSLAEVALPYAEEITGKMNTGLILLSVLPSEEAREYERHYRYTSKIVEATRRHIAKYCLNTNGNISVGTATRAGHPAEGILDYVSKSDRNFVVMATHGRSGLNRWAMGSIADKVVRTTTRQPLMLIRAKGAYPDVRARRILKKALVPLDGSACSESVIPCIMELAGKLAMEITLLQVVNKRSRNGDIAEAKAYLQGWCLRFHEKSINAGYELRTGFAADQIIDTADELAADVVAMSTHGKHYIGLGPLGSVAQRVLLGGNTPLLLVRAS